MPLISVGKSAQHVFAATEDDMAIFRRLSNDTSLIHCDRDYARERGFDDVIVYGGIMLAHLSHMVGEHLPGRHATSASWTITYRNPLYVGQEATLELTITSVSKATGFVEGRYTIVTAENRIAQGKTQSIVPGEMIDDRAEADTPR